MVRRGKRDPEAGSAAQGDLLRSEEGDEQPSDADPGEKDPGDADPGEKDAEGAEPLRQAPEGPDSELGGAEEVDLSRYTRVPPRDEAFHAPPRDLPRDMVERIEELEAEGELYGALELVDEGLVGHELAPALLMRRVRILARLRRFDEAEEPLRTLRLVEPHAPEVRLAAGMLWFRKGLYAEAERDLRAISFKDEVEDRVRREAEYYLAESLNRLSRLDEALELLHTSVKRFPQPRAFQLLGRLYDRRGSPDEASIMYRIAREMGS